ncbi:hypothetical protein PFBG_04023 [Plasmodium falciparum 7G8]|uniref:Uncharacterized protein n=1 Tax=Plasmodium falciparum (isolate 7G8) TaxID=57266 RepID=W7F4I2_PLAF8|nr:hypothetical protein PFBG_04023 [Plasmodium falciparum 7G8]
MEETTRTQVEIIKKENSFVKGNIQVDKKNEKKENCTNNNDNVGKNTNTNGNGEGRYLFSLLDRLNNFKKLKLKTSENDASLSKENKVIDNDIQQVPEGGAEKKDHNNNKLDKMIEKESQIIEKANY